MKLVSFKFMHLVFMSAFPLWTDMKPTIDKLNVKLLNQEFFQFRFPYCITITIYNSKVKEIVLLNQGCREKSVIYNLPWWIYCYDKSLTILSSFHIMHMKRLD